MLEAVNHIASLPLPGADIFQLTGKVLFTELKFSITRLASAMLICAFTLVATNRNKMALRRRE
jgi:hypothetical protein